MVKPMSRTFILVSLSLLAAAASAAPAQTTPPPDPALESAEAAMANCATAVSTRRQAEALAQAAVAEAAFRARLAVRPNDVRALVGLARTLGSCRIPGADFALAGELSAESIELLQRALEVEPAHWTARYVLALNYYRAPAFLGRSQHAARELDRLIAQQGDRADVSEFARTFEYRGLLWSRAGERDSALAVWQRGQRLFPADTALRGRIEAAGSAASGPPDPDAPRDAATPASYPASASIETVHVVASRAVQATGQATPGERRLTRSEIVMAPGAMADVLQAVGLHAGATRVGESAELFARGGDPAETPTFIDGGRIASVARFEGLSGSTFGALDPWVVQSARFSTGGFSVQYGNALSGVLAIETDGRPRATQWRLGAGLAQAGATARIPLGRRAGTWGTLRGTHAGALLRTHGRDDEFARTPYSVEAMGAFIAQPKVGTEYRAVGMVVRDASARIVDANGYRGPFDSDGTTHALILTSQHLADRRPMIVRTNLALSERITDWRFGVLARDRTERTAAARAGMEYTAGTGVTLRGGVEGGLLSRAESGAVPMTSAVEPGAPTRFLPASDSGTWHLGSHVEADMRLGRFNLLAGVRGDRLPGERQVTVDPRVSVSTSVGSWTTRLAGGLFHQGRWRAEASIPDPGTPAGLPRQARHLVAGVEHSGTIALKAEAFVKDYAEYGAFGVGPQIVDGSARGVDIVAQRAGGSRLTGSLGYSLLQAELELKDGRTVRSPYDVTHTVTGSATLRLASRTTLGSSLRFGSGRPYTPILGGEPENGDRVAPVYGAPTSERLPAYSRLDARLTRYIPLRRAMLVGFVEILNLLDRQNVAGYVWDADYTARRATTTFYSERTVMVGFELQSH
jgi:tetratricopeptide (TPR) repeat protein